MTEKQKMIAGDFYDSQDAELVAGRARARQLTEALNHAPIAEGEKREAIFRELLGGRVIINPGVTIGDGAVIG